MGSQEGGEGWGGDFYSLFNINVFKFFPVNDNLQIPAVPTLNKKTLQNLMFY